MSPERLNNANSQETTINQYTTRMAVSEAIESHPISQHLQPETINSLVSDFDSALCHIYEASSGRLKDVISIDEDWGEGKKAKPKVLVVMHGEPSNVLFDLDTIPYHEYLKEHSTNIKSSRNISKYILDESIKIARENNATPTPQEQQSENSYEYKSIHAIKIEKAIDAAIEHQKTLKGWQDNVEPTLKHFLQSIFDDLSLRNNEKLNEITILDIENYVINQTTVVEERMDTRITTPGKSAPFASIENVLQKLHGTNFRFRTIAENTLDLAQNYDKTISKLERRRAKLKKN